MTRIDLSGDPTTAQVLERVREAERRAAPHQDVPFAHLVAELAEDHHPAVHPLFQAALTLGGTAASAAGLLELPGVRVSPLTTGEPATAYDVEVGLEERTEPRGAPAGLHGQLIVTADLFEPEAAGRLADGLLRVLHTMAADPRSRVSALDLVDAAERHRVLEEWNDTGRTVPEATVPELFEAQAARTPDAVAVVAGGDQLTYGELDARATRLAWRLVTEHGVGPESVVAVFMERAPELIVAILAVLKAGGAYLPVDPHYPAERVAHTLDDARPVCLLTRRRCAPAVPPGRDVPLLVLDAPRTAGRARGPARGPADAAPRAARGVRHLHLRLHQGAPRAWSSRTRPSPTCPPATPGSGWRRATGSRSSRRWASTTSARSGRWPCCRERPW